MNKTLKEQQKYKLDNIVGALPQVCKTSHTTINEITNDAYISISNRTNSIIYSILLSAFELAEIEEFLRNYEDKNHNDYRKLLCAYDYMKYKDII